MNICYCCSAYSQAYLLSGTSVDFVLFAKCLCSHYTTPHLPLPSMHIPNVLPAHTHTLCLHCTWDKSTANLFPHPTLNLQEPRTQHTSDIWRHHSGPGQRPCSTAELESTGQSNLFQICYLGSTPGGREASLPRPTEQVLVSVPRASEQAHVVKILSCNTLLVFAVVNYTMTKYYFCSCVVWNVLAAATFKPAAIYRCPTSSCHLCGSVWSTFLRLFL